MARIVTARIRQTERSSQDSPLDPSEVVDHLLRVYKNSQLQMQCFVVAFGYLHRLVRPKANGGLPALVFDRSNWMLLLTTAILIAQKFDDDDSYLSRDFAKLLAPVHTGVQLNKMEVTFLVGLNWDCSFTPRELETHYSWLAEAARSRAKPMKP